MRLSPILATPSLGFHPLIFSLSLVKFLIDTLPARLLHSCQMPSDTEEYCANTITSQVLTVSLCFNAELGSTSPATSPHLPVLSQDLSCDGTGGTVSSLLAAPESCFSKNMSSALLSAGKYFEAGEYVFFSSLICQSEHFLIAAWLHIFTRVYKR